MNCFEWQNQSSDHLDGNLIGAAQQEAEEHLASCPECSERYKRYRIILSSIASQNRAALPIPIRKAPLSAAIPRLNLALLTRSHWERIPWFIRTTLEGVGIVTLILVGISTGPKIRSLYEKRIEHNLNEFTQAFNDPTRADQLTANSSGNTGAIPLTRGRAVDPRAEAGNGTEDDYAGEGEDNSGEGEEDVAEDTTPPQGATAQTLATAPDAAQVTKTIANTTDGGADIEVGNSELWRFMMKTDSPHEIRPKIVRILTDLKIPPNTPGLGGVEAPGGIQFDLLVAQSVVPALKKQLQAIAPKAPEDRPHLAANAGGDTFTWYKRKLPRKLPDQKARVVIWLSQM